jgi:hypothetical protein
MFTMNRSLAGSSLLLFGVSILILVALTVFESALAGLSPGVERLLTLLFLVLPPGAGSVLGVMSLVRREGKVWMAAAGAILNAFFALFHLAIVFFAG